MPTIGPMELAVVFVIALLVLGPKRLPQAGRSIGQGMREFKDSLRNADPRELDERRTMAEAGESDAPASRL